MAKKLAPIVVNAADQADAIALLEGALADARAGRVKHVVLFVVERRDDGAPFLHSRISDGMLFTEFSQLVKQGEQEAIRSLAFLPVGVLTDALAPPTDEARIARMRELVVMGDRRKVAAMNEEDDEEEGR